MSTASTVRRLSVALATVPFLACSQGPSPEVQAQLDALQAQRDSLTRELALQDEYVNSLSRQIEEAVGGMEGEGGSESLGNLIGTLREDLVTARTQADEAQQRIAVLNRRAANLRDSLATVSRRAEETAAAQRDSIAALVSAAESMDARISELADTRAGLEDSLETLEERTFTTYYAVGTSDELLRRGVLEEEGGARILLVLWRAGETLVPARDLDTDDFQAIDSRQTTTIELAAGTYRVVSRHDTRYLEPSPDGDGRFTGESLRITDPDAFWRFSPFLILVQED